MKYLVMECHPGYAVVLDEEGRFLKAANEQYEVGQTVTEIRELPPARKTGFAGKGWTSLAALAACLMVMVTAVFQGIQAPYASVYMTINPEVRIDVNRRDVVVGLEGVNPDGQDLTQGYDFAKKDLDLVMDELVDRAMEMGYLSEGGRIQLTLEAGSQEWVVTHSESLSAHLSQHLEGKVSAAIVVNGQVTQAGQTVVPVAPEESDYGLSDYGGLPPEDRPQTDAGDSDYGDSDYSDSGYGSSDYGDSGYGSSDYGGSGYGDSGYEEPEADSPYDEPEDDSGYDRPEADSPYWEDGETDYGEPDDSGYEDED